MSTVLEARPLGDGNDRPYVGHDQMGTNGGIQGPLNTYLVDVTHCLGDDSCELAGPLHGTLVHARRYAE